MHLRKQTEESHADLCHYNQRVHCCQTILCAACCWTALCSVIHYIVHYNVYALPFVPESLPLHILEPCVHRVSANLL